MKNLTVDSSREAIFRYVENANAILGGVKKIDVMGCGRQGKATPIEETVGALKECVEEGLIGGIQLSEVSAASIKRAASVAKIDMVEAEISLWATEVFSNGVAEICAEKDIILVAHTPLGAGMLTGQIRSLDDMEANDYHRYFPRFQPENFAKNLQLVEEVRKLAQKKNVTMAQLALCWIKTQSKREGFPVLVPVFGARSEERVRENATEVEVSEEDLVEIHRLLDSFPVEGNRNCVAMAEVCEF